MKKNYTSSLITLLAGLALLVNVSQGAAQGTAFAYQGRLTTGTNADFLCLSSGGVVLLQTSACTISSLRFKPDWKPYDANAMSKIAATVSAGTSSAIPCAAE